MRDHGGHHRAVRIRFKVEDDFILVFGRPVDITQSNTADHTVQTVFRAVFAHSGLSAALLDANLSITWLSSNWSRNFRTNERDLIGKSVFEMFPMAPVHWRAAYRDALAGRTTICELEPYQKGRAGRIGWRRWETHPVRDAAGSVVGIAILGQDMTG
jgi:PAS domain-containing protein